MLPVTAPFGAVPNMIPMPVPPKNSPRENSKTNVLLTMPRLKVVVLFPLTAHPLPQLFIITSVLTNSPLPGVVRIMKPSATSSLIRPRFVLTLLFAVSSKWILAITMVAG
jgi:hypothetical protein